MQAERMPARPGWDESRPNLEVARPPEAGDALQRSFRLLLLVLAVLVLSIVNRADPDLWGHVRYGQDVLREKALPATCTYTFTAPDQPWVNHENLAEVAFAAAFDAVGVPGLTLLRSVLGLLVFALIVGASRRRGASLWSLAVVTVLVAFNLMPWWRVRPQLFTMVSFTLMMAALDRAFGDRSEPSAERWLWTLPPLFGLWANTHGGFVAGYAILAAYLGCQAVESWWRGRLAFGQIARYAAVLALSGAATAVNPYGVDLLVWLARDLAPPRPEITEWASLTLADPLFYLFVPLALLTVVTWGATRRPRTLAQTVLLAVTAWQSVAHERHVPFFAILVGLWLPAHLDGLRARFARPKPAVQLARSPARGLAAIRLVTAAMTIALVVALGVRARRLDVRRATYPVEAFAFMAEHGLVGKMVVYFDWAQYAIAAFAPPGTVDFDGRFRTSYPQWVADMHFDFIIGDRPGKRWRTTPGPVDPERSLDFGTPDLAVLDRRAPHAIGVIQRRPDWVLLYQDALAQVWGRRARYARPDAPDYLPPERRSITERVQEGVVQWPALPSPARTGAAAAG